MFPYSLAFLEVVVDCEDVRRGLLVRQPAAVAIRSRRTTGFRGSQNRKRRLVEREPEQFKTMSNERLRRAWQIAMRGNEKKMIKNVENKRWTAEVTRESRPIVGKGCSPMQGQKWASTGGARVQRSRYLAPSE